MIRSRLSLTINFLKDKPMYQAKTGQQPPAAGAAALAKFEQAKAEQIAVGVAHSGGLMPRNLTTEQRRAVVALVKNVTTKII